MFAQYLEAHDLGAALLAKEARRPFPLSAERKRWNELPEAVRKELLLWGDEAKNGYPMVTACQFLAFTRTGDRQIFEEPYFKRRRLLMGAVLAECVAGDGSYLDAVIDGLWCICEETSWVLSAHNGSSHPGARPAKEHPLPEKQNPYIDLFAAQTSATLSYALYFLDRQLNAVTPLIARRVRQEIEQLILIPFMIRDDFWWMGMIRKDVNNWTPWILSNVIDTLLLLVDDPVQLTDGLKRALRMLDAYLAVMPADGGCDEGCSYWNMAGASLLDCLESIYLATGGKVSFYDEPLIQAIGAFPAKAYIGNGYYWNFADCDARPMMDGQRLYCYGQRTHNPALTALGAYTAAQCSTVRPIDTPQMNRVLFRLFQMPPQPQTKPVIPAHASLPALQVFSWNQNGLYIAVKGGHNGESHNHNDVGSFLVYADGQPEIVDAGNMVYTAKTFSDQRYTLWNTRTRNHNLPLINGIEQQAGAEHRAKDVQAQEHCLSMELCDAYPAEAGLTSFQRRFVIEDGRITLSDCISLTEPKPITWVWMLRSKPECHQNEWFFGKLKLTVSPSLSAELEEIPVEDARMSQNFPGSLWRLSFTAPAALSQKQNYMITRS
ncbi:MAG: heparinase II/III family protein [Eubacteriales bacterium]|nr:heparinase II/III family protein [Eubacteriales bacterium]